MLFLLVALAFCASAEVKCTFDKNTESSDQTNFEVNENYHERYCGTECPCRGVEGCVLDYTEFPDRDLSNVTGTVATIIGKTYDLTFALRVKDTLSVETVMLGSNRTQYKLEEGATLSVGKQQKVGGTNGSFCTIIRCTKSCTIKNSNFEKDLDYSITFINNPDNTETNTTINIDTVTFTIDFASDDRQQVFTRENVVMGTLKAVFKIKGTNEDVLNHANTQVPLFYSENGFNKENTEVTAQLNDGLTGITYTVDYQCDGKWIVAVPSGDSKPIECFDPTISTGDQSLEDGCDIAFIVIICMADVTLLLVLGVFGTLAILQFLKNRKHAGTEGADAYMKINDATVA
uniref:Uncharacterized protein n=1 Tax=Entamoeba invadens TaxID=33085 RepID=S0B1U2_ENTIV|nr:hypothetical protein [Entamoeba invadens]